MSFQLEIVKFRDLIAVNGIPRLVPGMSEPTIEVIGEDFSSVEKVLINEMLVSEFIIVNRTTLWAQLPRGVDTVQTIEVQSSGFTRTRAGSKVTFSIGDRTKKVSGILKLTQLFTKWMLQTPNTDIFNPERGGGLQQLVGTITTSKRMEPVLAMVARAVDLTSQQIRTAQATSGRTPLSEKLLSATLEDLNIIEDKMEAIAKVRIVSMAGDEAISDLML